MGQNVKVPMRLNTRPRGVLNVDFGLHIHILRHALVLAMINETLQRTCFLPAAKLSGLREHFTLRRRL